MGLPIVLTALASSMSPFRELKRLTTTSVLPLLSPTASCVISLWALRSAGSVSSAHRDDIDLVRHLEKRFLKMPLARARIDHDVIEFFAQHVKQACDTLLSG